MTFATFTNLIVSILCVAVVLQSMRMMRNVREIKSDNFGDTIKSLDQATTQARTVLADLKLVLTTDGAANARSITSGESLRDELSLMVGIGNAVADRIMEAAAAAERHKEESAKATRETAKAAAPKLDLPAKPRRKRSTAAKVATPAHTRLQ
jgi:hypothetical protein